MRWLYRLSCALGKCWRCRLHSTDDGIGGKCVDCGRVHGWMTYAEIRECMTRSANL